jgi:glycosyltransferase involved in cell wall biosynthesis
MTNPATFSAIILNYNHSRFIDGALGNALGQTRPFDEIIVIDDASTDESVLHIRKCIEGRSQARLIENPHNLGVVPSCNLGLQLATGDFVFFMAADDRYSTRIVEWCEAALRKYPDVAMISGDTRICFEKSGGERLFTLPFAKELGRYNSADIEARRRVYTFNMGANMMRREAILAAGQFLPDLKWHSDWFVYLLLGSRAPFAYMPEEFVGVRQADDQYSHACFHWKTQKPVIEAFVRALEKDYPRDYEFFRRCALLPTYDCSALALIATCPAFWRYATPLLLWRLLTYKCLRRLSKLCPPKMRAMLRKIVRV